MSARTRRHDTLLTYVEWQGLLRFDADGDDCAPLVRIYFTAGGWQPYVRATWDQPAEGGLFEDVFLLRAVVDPDEDAPVLTVVERAAAEAWFQSREGWDAVQDAAMAEAGV